MAIALKAKAFVKQAFGIDAKHVWTNLKEGAILLSYDTGKRPNLNPLLEQARAYFADVDGTVINPTAKKQFGSVQTLDIFFSGHKIKVSRYNGGVTQVHILLINTRESGWWNAI